MGARREMRALPSWRGCEMKALPASLPGVWVIELVLREDPRGLLAREEAHRFLKLCDPFGWPSGGVVLYLEFSYALAAFDLVFGERDACRHGRLSLAGGRQVDSRADRRLVAPFSSGAPSRSRITHRAASARPTAERPRNSPLATDC